MQELMKLPNTEHRVADIGAKRLPKRRLEQRIWNIKVLCICDLFLPMKQDQTVLNQNQLHQDSWSSPCTAIPPHGSRCLGSVSLQHAFIDA